MIDDNTNTVLAMERIYFEDPEAWEEGLFDSTEYAMELDRRNPVLEGVWAHLKKIGVEIPIDDKKSIIKELNRRYIEMGIVEGVPKSVKNWLSGTPVNPAYRENLYNLCLSLNMNEEEIRIFFFKNYMTIPFNYKDQVDAVYYYGICNKKSYLAIRQLLDKLEQEDLDADVPSERTEDICRDISEIEDDEVLMEYLRHHSYGKNMQFQTAQKILDELAMKNAKLASVERSLKSNLLREKERSSKIDENDVRDKNVLDELDIIKVKKENDVEEIYVDYKALLYVIYGFDNQERYKQKKTQMSKSEYLPKRFRENFPKDQEFARINMRTASPEVYRKALIIMNFYNFFCMGMMNHIYGVDYPDADQRMKKPITDYLVRDDEIIEKDMEDFYYETSTVLEKCGFVQLYARNPFDWLILYCAKSTDPMDTLRELLKVRYTELDED